MPVKHYHLQSLPRSPKMKTSALWNAAFVVVTACVVLAELPTYYESSAIIRSIVQRATASMIFLFPSFPNFVTHIIVQIPSTFNPSQTST
jgi:hypothetical protein